MDEDNNVAGKASGPVALDGEGGHVDIYVGLASARGSMLEDTLPARSKGSPDVVYHLGLVRARGSHFDS
jgi:hypothetical protein